MKDASTEIRSLEFTLLGCVIMLFRSKKCRNTELIRLGYSYLIIVFKYFSY